MAHKPERWTACSCAQLPDGTMRTIREDVFELSKQPDGRWECKKIASNQIMDSSEQEPLFEQMMENTGKAMSEYASTHPDSKLPEGRCEIMKMLTR